MLAIISLTFSSEGKAIANASNSASGFLRNVFVAINKNVNGFLSIQINNNNKGLLSNGAQFCSVWLPLSHRVLARRTWWVNNRYPLDALRNKSLLYLRVSQILSNQSVTINMNRDIYFLIHRWDKYKVHPINPLCKRRRKVGCFPSGYCHVECNFWHNIK